MAELIHQHSTNVRGEDGMTYHVRVWAAERTDGTWDDYWAAGLEPIYLDGAFARAQGRLP